MATNLLCSLSTQQWFCEIARSSLSPIQGPWLLKQLQNLSWSKFSLDSNFYDTGDLDMALSESLA